LRPSPDISRKAERPKRIFHAHLYHFPGKRFLIPDLPAVCHDSETAFFSVTDTADRIRNPALVYNPLTFPFSQIQKKTDQQHSCPGGQNSSRQYSFCFHFVAFCHFCSF